MNTQTVSQTPDAEPSQAPVEEVVAQEPDLDSLLAEYDQPEVPVETPTEAPVVNAEVAEMRQLLAEARQDKVNAGLTEAAGFVKNAAGDIAANIPDRMFRGLLREADAENPKIGEIFNNRASDPEAWKNVATALGKKFAGEMTPVDEASTKSWEAVSAAVHSSSTTTPKPAEEVTSKSLRNMSNAEFAAHQKKMGFKR